MKILNTLFVLLLAIGLLGFTGIAFAGENNIFDSGIVLKGSEQSSINVPLMKGGGKGGGSGSLRYYGGGNVSGMGVWDWVFVIISSVLIVGFAIWYSKKGKFLKMSYRIGIIIALLLAIFIPLYLFGSMLFFIIAIFIAFVVLISLWYTEHGQDMSTTRLLGSLALILLVTCLVIGLPTYVYFTTAEDINDVTVSSTNATLEIIDYRVYVNTFTGSDVKFQGYVRNNGNSPANLVKVNATGYDEAGNVVSNQSSFVNDEILLPGRTSPFGKLSNYPGWMEDPQNKIVRVKLEVI